SGKIRQNKKPVIVAVTAANIFSPIPNHRIESVKCQVPINARSETMPKAKRKTARKGSAQLNGKSGRRRWTITRSTETNRAPIPKTTLETAFIQMRMLFDQNGLERSSRG